MCLKIWLTLPLALAIVASVAAQDEDTLFTRNPLDEIRDELIKVLEDAGLPFTIGQEESITFVLEESRRASEQLFGDVMNFRSGPPRGERLDQAMAGINWMNEDFAKRVRKYLNPDQLDVWDAYIESRMEAAEESEGDAGTSQQVQQIRVNRNPFTAERQYSGQPSSGGSYGYSSGGGVQAQVISRGGTGAWHGSFQFQLKDEALDARNPFASNKPSYQQRNINLNLSGPLIPNRLTLDGGFSQSMQDNAATVNAITLEGPFQLGFTRPRVSRSGGVSGIYQITPEQSLHFNYYRQRYNSAKQGMGGFSLPERAVDYKGGYEYVSFRHVWFASERLVQDISFGIDSSHQQSTPVTAGRSVNVLGAFNGGSGQNWGRGEDDNLSIRSLWIYTSGRWIIRAGGGFSRISTNERSESNFQGTFTFPDLEAYRNGIPILYTQIQGDPVLVNSQIEWNGFFQNEFDITDRITMFFGVRYQGKSNLKDYNNFDPRLAFAFAVDKSTVVRAGIGVFRLNVPFWIENTLIQRDGKRQAEIVINNPSYPDPFQSGEITIVPPSSRRLRAGDLAAPYSVNTSLQIERSFPRNLFVTASYDYHKGFHILRSRNLNAPPPGESERPNPLEGNIWLLESSGISKFKAVRITMRQRFSIFSLSANYSREVRGNVITNFGAPADNFNLRADYAEYVRHSFNTSINSRLFWEIYLSSNISFGSGSPYTITTGYDDNGDGVTNDRPEGVPRYSMRGPHRNNVSFNLSKAFTLNSIQIGGAPANINLFANLNNAFNRTNLGTPVGIMSSPYFGQSVSASSPRQITIGMRFQF